MHQHVDDSYRLLAAKHFRKQARQLADQFEGIRLAEDIECLHRARVASRRLRAGLQMFRDCLRAKQSKRWRKAIRRVTAGLGEARDHDVQIEFLCGVLSILPQKAQFPGIARLLVRLERERDRLQRQVVKAIDRLEASGVLEEIRAASKEVCADARQHEVRVQSQYVCGRARQHVGARLQEMLRYEESLQHPDDVERHHAMRIAAKQLRYSLELVRPVYRKPLDGSIAVVKQLQTYLGDLHDCDVWLERLAEFTRRERRWTAAKYGHARAFARLEVGIDYLRQERQRQRERLFQELLEYWQELVRQGAWDRLKRVLETPAERHAESPQPAEAARADRSTSPAGRHLPTEGESAARPTDTLPRQFVQEPGQVEVQGEGGSQQAAQKALNR